MKRIRPFWLVLLLLTVSTILLVGCGNTTTTSDDRPNQSNTSAHETDGSSQPIESSSATSSEGEDSVTSSDATTAPEASSTPDATTAPISVSTDAPVTQPPVTEPPVTTEVDDTPAPPRGTDVKIKYVVNDASMGSIIGKTEQTVKYGLTTSSTVSVASKLGYRFAGWSDGSKQGTRSGECPKKDTVYTAIFEYDTMELPILSLRTDSGYPVIDKENYVSGSISILNAPDGYNFDYIPMEIRGRGNYTWGSTFNADERYNKRPYKIKLSEKKNLLGQGNGKAKIWTLIANHCDQSLLRNQTSYNFAKSLPGIIWQPSASSVEVYLNGEYIGVYMLSEQVQVNSKRIDLPEDYESSDEIAFLIHRSGYAQYPRFDIDGQPYEVVNDLSVDPVLAGEQLEYIRSRIEDCWNVVKYNGDKEAVASLIDLNSVVDTYIVHELFKNLDTGWDNFYMFSNVNDVLHFGPIWDFDQCAGNADVGVEDYRGIRGGIENKWYENFLRLNWFKEMVRDRWDELLPQIRQIPDYIHNEAKAAYNSYCRNFDRWQIFGLKINRETEVIRNMHTYQEHVDYFAQWMFNRTNWMNQYLHSSDFIHEEIKLKLTGKGTAADPYKITSAADFYNLTQVMLTGETFEGKYFMQTADIDMNEISFYNGIGAPAVFAGVYNGNGYTITASIAGDAVSFFPYVTGTIMNVITAGFVRNSGITGGIARSVRIGGKIINCGSYATLSSFGNVGGIVPSNQGGGGAVIGCFFAGTIENAADIGPINCYVRGREGVFQFNYYASDYTSHENQQRHTVESDSSSAEPDNAFRRDQMEQLAAILNANRDAISGLSGISSTQLCSWTFQNGKLVMSHK